MNATAATLSVPVNSGQSYLVEQPSALTTSLPFAQVTGSVATAAKHLGGVKIGIDAAATAGAGVTLYPNASFGGTGVTFGVGSYTLAAGETNLTVDAGLYQKAALGDETPERTPDERGAIDEVGARVGRHPAPTSSGIPVSRVETAQSLAIADSIPGRRIGLRTGGPLLTHNGP